MRYNLQYVIHGTAMTGAELKLDFKLTIDTDNSLSRLAFGVSGEDLGGNWPRYNGTALYFVQGTVVAPLYSAQIFLKQ